MLYAVNTGAIEVTNQYKRDGRIPISALTTHSTDLMLSPTSAQKSLPEAKVLGIYVNWTLVEAGVQRTEARTGDKRHRQTVEEHVFICMYVGYILLNIICRAWWLSG